MRSCALINSFPHHPNFPIISIFSAPFFPQPSPHISPIPYLPHYPYFLIPPSHHSPINPIFTSLPKPDFPISPSVTFHYHPITPSITSPHYDYPNFNHQFYCLLPTSCGKKTEPNHISHHQIHSPLSTSCGKNLEQNDQKSLTILFLRNKAFCSQP